MPVPVFDEANSGEETSDGEGSLGLKMLIWTDRRRERKIFADAWGSIVLGRVAVES